MDRAELVRAVSSVRASSARPVLVAIDGRSGSGKSWLAAELAPLLRAAVVPGDDFYRVMDDDERRALHAASGAARYFDWERLRAEALVPLRDDGPAAYHPFDWSGHRGADPAGTAVPPTAVPPGLSVEVREIEPRDVVLVEGVYSARAELADLVELAVLVEVDRATRLRRLAERAAHDPDWHIRWESAEAYYFSTLRPPETFDVLVAGH